MSFYIVVSVLKHSEAKLAKRLVMIALADAAGRDGVTWISLKQIAATAKLSQTHVSECLTELERDGEIQKRKAQVGRRRISVYRVMMPGVEEIDYDRLPFKLSDHFGNTEVVAEPTTSDPPSDGFGISEVPIEDSAKDPVNRSSPTARTPAERPRNLPFDALVEECPGTDPKVDGGKIGRALSDIRKRIEGEQEMHPEWQYPENDAELAREIAHRAALYRQKWPDIDLTVTALAHNWTRVRVSPGNRVTAAQVFAGIDPREL